MARPFILVFVKCTHGHTDGQLLLARRNDGLSDSLEFWNSWMLARFWAMRSCTDITYELLEVTHTGLDAAHLVRPFGTDTRELCQASNIEPSLVKKKKSAKAAPANVEPLDLLREPGAQPAQRRKSHADKPVVYSDPVPQMAADLDLSDEADDKDLGDIGVHQAKAQGDDDGDSDAPFAERVKEPGAQRRWGICLACVRACVRVCARVRVRARVCVCV